MGLALRHNLPETGLALSLPVLYHGTRPYGSPARAKRNAPAFCPARFESRIRANKKGQAFDLSLCLCRRRDSNPNALADTRF